MRNKQLGLLLSFVFFLSACLPPTQQIEKLAIISARGIDITENNEMEKTLNLIRFDPEADSIFTTVSGSAKTLKGAREDAGYQTGYILKEGQLSVELYGKEAAQRGIAPYISGSVRDARVSDTMKLAVSNTTAKEIFESNSEKAKTMGQYLDYLIDKEEKQDRLPPSGLHDFTRKATTKGQDGALPLIGLKNNEPTILGMAIFQDYKYVTDISRHEGMLLNLFLHKLVNTPIELTFPLKPFKKYVEKASGENRNIDKEHELSALFLIVKGKSKSKVTNLQNLSFDTKISLELNLEETSLAIQIDDEKVYKRIEKEVEKKIKNDYEQLLKKCQEVNSDPFGYGKIYRANTKDGKVTSEEWRSKFPDIKVDYNVDVKLMHTGTIQ